MQSCKIIKGGNGKFDGDRKEQYFLDLSFILL